MSADPYRANRQFERAFPGTVHPRPAPAPMTLREQVAFEIELAMRMVEPGGEFWRDEAFAAADKVEPAERVAHLMDCAYMSIESFMRKREGRERLACTCGMAEKYGQEEK